MRVTKEVYKLHPRPFVDWAASPYHFAERGKHAEAEKARRGISSGVPPGAVPHQVHDEGRRAPRQGGIPVREGSQQSASRHPDGDIDRDEYFDERKGEMLFKDFAAEYLELKKGDVSEGSFRNWKSLLNTTLLPTFGNKKLNEITDGLVEVWWSRNANKKVNRRNAFFKQAP